MRIDYYDLYAQTLDGREIDPWREILIDGEPRDVKVEITRDLHLVPDIKVDGVPVAADFYHNAIPIASSRDHWSRL